MTVIQYMPFITSEKFLCGRLVSRVTVSNTLATPEAAFIWLMSQGRHDNGTVVNFGVKLVEVEDEDVADTAEIL